MKQEKWSQPDKEVFLEIFRRFVEIPPGQNAWKYLQNIIQIIIKPAALSWVFCHEILSGKWVMSGLVINQFPRLLYAVSEYYLLLSLSLFQILIAVSPEPSKTIDILLSIYNIDKWMKLLSAKLMTNSLVKGDFDQFKPLFDEKKLRQLIHW